MKELIESVQGARQLFDWFGYWPSFHDAEVLSVELNRTGTSKVRVHTFRMTKEVSPKGFYVCDKHCIVTFVFEQITGVEFAEFNHQNVLQSLELRHEDDEFVLLFTASYGLEGTIRTKNVKIEIALEIPVDSQYKNLGT